MMLSVTTCGYCRRDHRSRISRLVFALLLMVLGGLGSASSWAQEAPTGTVLSWGQPIQRSQALIP